MPEATLETLKACGVGLFGAVQSPTYPVMGYRSAILQMRQRLELYANIRPIISLPKISPKPNIDIIVIRENSEGLYIGDETSDGQVAVAQRRITRVASERIGQVALQIMQRRQRKKLTIVHKANVLPLTDGLFRDSIRTVCSGRSLPFSIDELLVDVAALRMVGTPEQFDVVVTANLYGDILSDAAAHWGGGLGYAPSLNIGDECAVAEPVHGSAPDIAGQGLANPIAAVLSAAMLVEYSWGLQNTAEKIRLAVTHVLNRHPLPSTNVTQIIETRLLTKLNELD